MSANKNNQGGQNALTISSALETAYSDWNKNATSSSDPKLDVVNCLLLYLYFLKPFIKLYDYLESRK